MATISNATSVTHGVWAGSASTILWWALGQFGGVEAPAEVVAASVVMLTALAQAVIPQRSSAPCEDHPRGV